MTRTFSSNRLERIDALLQGYVERGELAGMSAALSRGGEIAYQNYFGWAIREEEKTVQENTIFEMKSMTKPVTAAAALTLYEEGHFHINTPVSKFLPAFAEMDVFTRDTYKGIETEPLQVPITMRHLFTHSSGLSYGFNMQDPIDRVYREKGDALGMESDEVTLAQLVDGLAEMPLAFQPGTRWRYGLSIDVIGRIVEVIAGMPLADFLRERIFESLGMEDTAYYVPESKLDRLAAIYGHPQGPEKLVRMDTHMPPAPTETPAMTMGGSGLFSTLGDYVKFAEMLANGGARDGVRVLAPKTVELMGMNHLPAAAYPYGFRENDLYHAGYGYGLGVRVLVDVAKSGIAGNPGEFGWDGAFATYFWVDPAESLAGVLLMQHTPNAYYPIAQQFKALAYQALVD